MLQVDGADGSIRGKEELLDALREKDGSDHEADQNRSRGGARFQQLDRLGLCAGLLGFGTKQAALSEKLWRTRFNRDFSIVGKTLRVNGRSVVVSGVATVGFVGAMRLIADIWLPTSAFSTFASPEEPSEAETKQVFGLITGSHDDSRADSCGNIERGSFGRFSVNPGEKNVRSPQQSHGTA